jgi:hypothetical protein
MRRAARIGVLALALAAAPACGYTLAGRGNSLPSNVRTIGVPDFENRSSYAGIDQAVTDAVRAEFASRGSLRVVPQEAGSDAVLNGIVLSVRTEPTAFNDARQATRYAVIVSANVEFRETGPNGTVLWSNPEQQFREEYDVSADLSAVDASTLFSQDANALDRLARQVARTIVTSILEAF